jgi:hypothetical protein
MAPTAAAFGPTPFAPRSHSRAEWLPSPLKERKTYARCQACVKGALARKAPPRLPSPFARGGSPPGRLPPPPTLDARWSSLTECPLNARLETGVDLSFFLSFPNWTRPAPELRHRVAVARVGVGAEAHLALRHDLLALCNGWGTVACEASSKIQELALRSGLRQLPLLPSATSPAALPRWLLLARAPLTHAWQRA